jgi:hypothetical protein
MNVPIFAFRRRLEAFGGDPREEGLSGGRDGDTVCDGFRGYWLGWWNYFGPIPVALPSFNDGSGSFPFPCARSLTPIFLLERSRGRYRAFAALPALLPFVEFAA